MHMHTIAHDEPIGAAQTDLLWFNHYQVQIICVHSKSSEQANIQNCHAGICLCVLIPVNRDNGWISQRKRAWIILSVWHSISQLISKVKKIQNIMCKVSAWCSFLLIRQAGQKKKRRRKQNNILVIDCMSSLEMVRTDAIRLYVVENHRIYYY